VKPLALLALLAACGDDTPVYGELPSTEVASYSLQQNHQLDLLILMEDTMADSQNNLAVAMPLLWDHLTAAAGGPPDVHFGLATSDLGTKGTDDPNPGPPLGQLGNGGCAGTGKDGLLQTSGAAVTDRYLIDDGVTRNYTGSRDQVVGAMIRAGAGGCGFEQHLAALDRALHNPGNAGFLRPTADLAIIIVAEEDDCSFRRPAFLGPESPELGRLESLRCQRFGLVCDEDLTTVGEKHRCHAREDSPLVPGVADYVSKLRGAAVRPPTVAAIVGPPGPVVLELRTPPGGGSAFPSLQHGCSYTGANGLEVADPAVRIADTIRGLEGHGMTTNYCTPDLKPAVARIANRIVGAFGVVCLDTEQLRDSSADPGIQPTCTATLDDQPVDSEIITDATLCDAVPGNLRVLVHAEPGATGTVRVRCDVP
jgi:hypothetical protein